jgi:hypothetical protein
VPPNPQTTPETGPVKVEIVQVPPPPGPTRGAGWWITTVGSVVIPALALAIAFVSLVYQHEADRAEQSTTARAYASQVSLVQETGSSIFEIENLAHAPIYSVWLQPATHGLESLGTLPPCSISTVSLTPTSKPTIYFRDANQVGWKLTINGYLQPSVDPSSIIDLLPQSIASGLARVTPRITTDCT